MGLGYVIVTFKENKVGFPIFLLSSVLLLQGGGSSY